MLAEILSTGSDLTIVDMEAGLEHLSRAGGTLAGVDRLLVVVEAYAKAIETGRRTVALARELGIPSIWLVGSKVRDQAERDLISELASEVTVDVAASLPYDEGARLADREGRRVIDAVPDGPFVRAVEDLAERLVQG